MATATTAGNVSSLLPAVVTGPACVTTAVGFEAPPAIARR